MDAAHKDRSTQVTIDLETQLVTALDSIEVNFPIDEFSKHCLLQGIDQLGYVLSFDEHITRHEQKRA